jgi:DNA transposition AAA+ family ATPase
MITKVDALISLRPGSQWNLRGETIEWLETNTTVPSEEEIQNEMAKLQAKYDAQEYARKRAPEYPPITDYLDGIVKGDEEQVQAYIDKFLEIKAKYPKGE